MVHKLSLDAPQREHDPALGQVAANAEIFHERDEPDLLPDHFGEIALMSGGELIAVFADYDAAFERADEDYAPGEFSLHHIGPAPVRYTGAYTVTAPLAPIQ